MMAVEEDDLPEDQRRPPLCEHFTRERNRTDLLVLHGAAKYARASSDSLCRKCTNNSGSRRSAGYMRRTRSDPVGRVRSAWEIEGVRDERTGEGPRVARPHPAGDRWQSSGRRGAAA